MDRYAHRSSFFNITSLQSKQGAIVECFKIVEFTARGCEGWPGLCDNLFRGGGGNKKANKNWSSQWTLLLARVRLARVRLARVRFARVRATRVGQF